MRVCFRHPAFPIPRDTMGCLSKALLARVRVKIVHRREDEAATGHQGGRYRESQHTYSNLIRSLWYDSLEAHGLGSVFGFSSIQHHTLSCAANVLRMMHGQPHLPCPPSHVATAFQSCLPGHDARRNVLLHSWFHASVFWNLTPYRPQLLTLAIIVKQCPFYSVVFVESR